MPPDFLPQASDIVGRGLSSSRDFPRISGGLKRAGGPAPPMCVVARGARSAQGRSLSCGSRLPGAFWTLEHPVVAAGTGSASWAERCRWNTESAGV